MKMFQTLRELGWAGASLRLDHVPFGTIMGPDGKPFKTRDGSTVRLSAVLDEAVHRTRKAATAKNADLPEETLDRIAHLLGVGSLKYADLFNDRIKDYAFDWDRMLSLNGHTAPYVLNAYVRSCAVFRRAGLEIAAQSGAAIRVTEAEEGKLAVYLLQFPRVVGSVAESLEPHRLCTFLYETAKRFHSFYENCSVLKDDVDIAVRQSRLALCALTARTLEQGLQLLGIAVVEKRRRASVYRPWRALSPLPRIGKGACAYLSEETWRLG